MQGLQEREIGAKPWRRAQSTDPHQVVQLCCLGMLEVRLKLCYAVRPVLTLSVPM